MQNLQHPETGGHILVHDPETAEDLIADGWEEIVDGADVVEAPKPKAKAKPKTEEPKTEGADEDDEPSEDEPSEIPAPEKPLTEMGLKDLLAYGARIGMPEEQLTPLSKPGSSKAEAIDAITAYVAAATAA